MFRNVWQRWLKFLERPSRRGRLTVRNPSRRGALALETLEERNLLSLFNAPLMANLPAVPVAEAVGHFRGPSAPLDAVTVSRDGTVSVLLGNGDGSFQAPQNISLGPDTFTNSVAVGDLGNGHPDIVVGNGNGTVDVLLGNGDGSFQSPTPIQVGSAGGVALGDFLGNGRQDIVLVRTGGIVSVLLNNGDGTFSAPIDTAIPGTQFTDLSALTVGDFNHDGVPGLAVGTDTGIVVLRGNGDGSFTVENTINLGINTTDHTPVGAFQLQSADLTGNGQTDLVAVTEDNVFPNSWEVRVLLGNGDGTFQNAAQLRDSPFNSVESLAVGDFTGDGIPDIATLNYGALPGTPFDSNLDVWAGNGDGTFHNLGVRFIGGPGSFGDFLLTAGDFRGDGKLDLLTAGGARSATVFLGNGDGSFNLAPTFAAGFSPVAIAKADFTGSGRPQDLVVVDSSGSISVLLGNGDGTFRAPVHPFGAPSEDSVVGLAVGDFLGNGKQDVAVGITDVYSDDNSVLIFLGNGDGTFQQTPLTLTLPGGFTNTIDSLAASDLNGDGRADLIVTSTVAGATGLTGEVSVLFSNGDGTFQAPEIFTVGTGVTDLAVADLRGDGVLDLVATTPVAGGQSAVDVLLGNGDGTFQNPVTVFTGPGGKLAVGDFLGDGRQDILTYTTGGTLSLLVNNGDGTFQGPVTTQTGLALGGVAVGDFVGTGHLGLAFTATDTGGVIVLQGNGDGTFQVAGDFLAGPDQGRSHFAPVRGLVAGDFNGDGKLDLITADNGPSGFGLGTITVLLNQGNGITAAPPTVDSITVNDGAVQRSEVTSLTVTFSTQVTLDPGALEVQRQDGSDVGLNVTTSVVGGHTVALVTFTGPDIVDGSLPDGSYTLTVHSGLVHDGSGQSLAQDATLSFFRVLGDVDGDGVIDNNDLAAAPTVTSVVLNEGDPTNAQVHSITVHFSEAVTLADGAFSLVRQDGSAITLIVSTTEVNGETVATITFSAADLIDGALPDGAYTFTIHGDQIHDGLGLALGHDFSGDRSVDFFGADGADQPDLVGLFHPADGGSGG
jgi:hypothetical protein